MSIEVTVVIPCLNEEQSLGLCIKKIQDCFRKNNVNGEVLISDNGSTDKSVEIAESLGARVVFQPIKGYGYALRKGIEEALGKYVIMGDADDSYDFSQIYPFIEKLREGYELVMGTRLKGKILKGAMPWLHQYIGNPVLTGILNLLFKSGISDAHCGLRCFSKEAYKKMQLKTTGMEFASEMVIKAAKMKMKITEIPITYYPDKRARPSHLRSFPDGWRHLRFMLMWAPKYFFIIPGFIFLLLGFICSVFIGFQFAISEQFFQFIILMCSGSFAMILGYFLINIGAYARVFALTEGFESESKMLRMLFKYFNLELVLSCGIVLFVINCAGILVALYNFFHGNIQQLQALYCFILFSTFIVISIQTIFSSFFLSMLGITREKYQGQYDQY